jgi:hypothetical protein
VVQHLPSTQSFSPTLTSHSPRSSSPICLNRPSPFAPVEPPFELSGVISSGEVEQIPSSISLALKSVAQTVERASMASCVWWPGWAEM